MRIIFYIYRYRLQDVIKDFKAHLNEMMKRYFLKQNMLKAESVILTQIFQGLQLK